MKKAIFLFSCLLLTMLLLRWYGRQPNGALLLSTLSHVDQQDSVLCLTFDDGPSAHLTPPLLELLAQLEVPAVFFVNGNKVEAHADIARDILRQGHQLANHSYQHDRMVWKWPADIEADLSRTDQLIRQAGSEDSRFFRPPYGDSFLSLPIVLHRMRKQYVGWSIEAKAQYDSPFSTQKVVDQTISQLQPGGIILLHDGWHRETTEFLQAVRQIVEQSRQEGYHFVPLSIPH
ncbi:MAG: polysaccharide deacetylase family protein [Bacteroidota bacterium]